MSARLSARIRCGESGHQWADRSWFVEDGAAHGLKTVFVRRQECVRTGCERTRKDTAHPRTFELLSRSYGGKLDRMPGATRADLRGMLIKES